MLLDSINEAIRIGEEGGVGVQVSHVKASGKENWPKIDAALRLFETARARGVDVLGDVYPYNAGSTKLDNMMPAWAHDGGIAKLLERLADRTTRRRIVEECLIDGERWGTVSQGGIGFDQVFIATCKRRELEGLNLAQIARQSGQPPAEVLMNLLLEEKCTVGMVSFSQSIENVAKVLAHPGAHDRLRLDPALRGRGRPARQAAPAHVRDVPPRARRVRARAAALLAGDGRPQDDRHGGGPHRPARARPGAARVLRRPHGLRSRPP